ncbi:MAG: hypothetical protein ACLFU2_07480 [Opitutales bacterium]
MKISIPDDLLQKMQEFGDRVDWSNVAAAAFAEFIAKSRILRDTSDVGAAVERLRASKRRYKETATEYWKSLGRRWAMVEAEFVQLMRLTSSYVRETQLEGWPIFDDHLLTPGQQLCEILDPGGNLHPDQIFGDQWTEVDKDSGAIKNFCDGAAEVFLTLRDKI